MIQNEIPFRAASETSREAARRIADYAPGQRLRVLEFIALAPDGATDEQIQEALGMNSSSERPRRTELMERRPKDSPTCLRLGLIRDSGRKRTTRSGCPATVWVTIKR